MQGVSCCLRKSSFLFFLACLSYTSLGSSVVLCSDRLLWVRRPKWCTWCWRQKYEAHILAQPSHLPVGKEFTCVWWEKCQLQLYSKCFVPVIISMSLRDVSGRDILAAPQSWAKTRCCFPLCFEP